MGLIEDWIKRKLDWKYIFAPVLTPLVIPAGQEIIVTPSKEGYQYPEGVLLYGIWLFDHPLCGVRLKASPDLDTAHVFTIQRMLLGGVTVPFNEIFAVRVPPDTLPGVFVFHSLKEWSWVKFVRFSVFNEDTAPHNCISFGWTIAVLTKERQSSGG